MQMSAAAVWGEEAAGPQQQLLSAADPPDMEASSQVLHSSRFSQEQTGAAPRPWKSRQIQTSGFAHTISVGTFSCLLSGIFLNRKEKKVVEIIFINIQRHPLSDLWLSAPSLSDWRRMSCQSPAPFHRLALPQVQDAAPGWKAAVKKKKKKGRAFGFSGGLLL